MSTSNKLLPALMEFAQALTDNFSLLISAQPEDQLKEPVKKLLRTAGNLFQLKTESRTEAQTPSLGRPDIGVAVSGLLCGHVELKAPGKGAKPENFRDADRKQWHNFSNLPNLIYTDGNEWALYRFGKRVGAVVKASGDVRTEGSKTFTANEACQLEKMLGDFLLWAPIVPASPSGLAELIAPLCRLLREDVMNAITDPQSNLSQLAADWRKFLFPEADDAQFADAYAQTLTYALLLARFSGLGEMRTSLAADTLEIGHGLLAQALRIMADPQAKEEISLGVELLERIISAVDISALTKKYGDPWLYFYEDFLAAYDPQLRNDRGVYYTPAEVVKAQAKLVTELLVNKFDKSLGFADDDVIFIDPACGTGTYLLAAAQHGLDLVRERFGAGAVSGRASVMAKNMHGFEILVGPYAVAHLRLTEQLLADGGSLPGDGAHIYLTDTLESPFSAPVGQQRMTLLHRRLTDEHERAQRVKALTRIFVCLGNPPYNRQQISLEELGTERKGGWVRFGDHGHDGILEDFIQPLSEAGQGVHAKNLYNDYVYFWRWALWKVLETTKGPGIVSFITASSYLRGPGFIGMRKLMREIFDEIWIVDLEGDQLGARKTENVFAIQTPVAIAIGVRYAKPQPEIPAQVHYTKLTGSRGEKLAVLGAITGFSSFDWRPCFDGWEAPFLPQGQGDYFSWPLLTDLFPWQHSGCQMKRTWPIGETEEVLESRWAALLSHPRADRALAFKETRDRQVTRQYSNSLDPDMKLAPIYDLAASEPPVKPVRYGYRSFDRQWILPDERLGDYMKPVLWGAHGDRQIYMVSLLTNVLGVGPAAVASAEVPDMHYFCNRGGKDIIPLWRDVASTQPNITNGLVDLLSNQYGCKVSPQDFFAYCYAILAAPEYVHGFSEELAIPGPRIPITKDLLLFQRAVDFGRRLINLHTYGARFSPSDPEKNRVPQGSARCVKAVTGQADAYPDSFSYNETTRTLRVGEGEFSPVARDVWEFSVSGLHVVKSWLAYRMRSGAGKKSSPLDQIRPASWTSAMTEELLELLWVLEATINLVPELTAALDQIIASDVFAADDLPRPSTEQTLPPGPTKETPAQMF